MTNLKKIRKSHGMPIQTKILCGFLLLIVTFSILGIDNVQAISRRVAPSRLLSINSTTKPKSTSIPRPKSTSTSQLQENIPTARFAASQSVGTSGTSHVIGTGMGSLSGINHFVLSYTGALIPFPRSGSGQPTIIQGLTAGFSPSAVQAIPRPGFAFSSWSDGVLTSTRNTISATNGFVYAIFRSL